MDVPGRVFVAFLKGKEIARGSLLEVASRLVTQPLTVRGSVLLFDAATSQPADIDFEGADSEVLARVARMEAAEGSAPAARRGPGRPRLGVVSREVTLLPRHWEWLNEQPGGASVTLRALVEQARKERADGDRIRRAREAVYRFMVGTCGDARGFEDASRALFAGDRAGYDRATARWPRDVRAHLATLTKEAFATHS